ncbi:MAG: hypothetical protein ABII19_02795 [Patescibacteria group bacterium]
MKKGFILATLAALVLGLAPMTASALTISPPLMEFDGRPGDSIVDVVKVSNETDEPLVLTSSVRNFKAMDETGTPEFASDTESTGLASWIQVSEKTVTLAVGERKSILFTINVPGDAEPGGHFAGILWSTGGAPAEDGPAVGVVAETGTLVLVRIAGEIQETGQLVEFSTDKTRYSYLPVDFNVRFENTGNVHVKPAGEVQIRNMWGRKVASLAVNDNLNSVLPDSIRKFDAAWQKSEMPSGASEWQKERENFAWGKYTATVILNYGVDNRVVTAEKSFWVFPWLVTLFYLVSVVIVVLLLTSGVKKYNKWLLKKYGKKVA